MALGAISVLLLIDVNEWINTECSECMTYHLNISLCFTRLHQSKRENHRKNCKCTQAFTLHNRGRSIPYHVYSRIIQTGFIPISALEDSSRPSSPAPFIFITDYNTSPWSDVSEEYAIKDEDFVVSSTYYTTMDG